MEYRKEQSDNDRRSIPRFGDKNVIDRRWDKKNDLESSSLEKKDLSNEDEVNEKDNLNNSLGLQQILIRMSKQIKEDLKKEFTQLNGENNLSINNNLENKNKKPGRPSSLPSIKESDEWPRKTYRFNKYTIKKLKGYQNSLDESKDLSILIDEALKMYLENK